MSHSLTQGGANLYLPPGPPPMNNSSAVNATDSMTAAMMPSAPLVPSNPFQMDYPQQPPQAQQQQGQGTNLLCLTIVPNLNYFIFLLPLHRELTLALVQFQIHSHIFECFWEVRISPLIPLVPCRFCYVAAIHTTALLSILHCYISLITLTQQAREEEWKMRLVNDL